LSIVNHYSQRAMNRYYISVNYWKPASTIIKQRAYQHMWTLHILYYTTSLPPCWSVAVTMIIWLL